MTLRERRSKNWKPNYDFWERHEINRGTLFRFAKLIGESWSLTIKNYTELHERSQGAYDRKIDSISPYDPEFYGVSLPKKCRIGVS